MYGIKRASRTMPQTHFRHPPDEHTLSDEHTEGVADHHDAVFVFDRENRRAEHGRPPIIQRAQQDSSSQRETKPTCDQEVGHAPSNPDFGRLLTQRQNSWQKHSTPLRLLEYE